MSAGIDLYGITCGDAMIMSHKTLPNNAINQQYEQTWPLCWSIQWIALCISILTFLRLTPWHYIRPSSSIALATIRAFNFPRSTIKQLTEFDRWKTDMISFRDCVNYMGHFSPTRVLTELSIVTLGKFRSHQNRILSGSISFEAEPSSGVPSCHMRAASLNRTR